MLFLGLFQGRHRREHRSRARAPFSGVAAGGFGVDVGGLAYAGGMSGGRLLRIEFAPENRGVFQIFHFPDVPLHVDFPQVRELAQETGIGRVFREDDGFEIPHLTENVEMVECRPGGRKNSQPSSVQHREIEMAAVVDRQAGERRMADRIKAGDRGAAEIGDLQCLVAQGLETANPGMPRDDALQPAALNRREVADRRVRDGKCAQRLEAGERAQVLELRITIELQ